MSCSHFIFFVPVVHIKSIHIKSYSFCLLIITFNCVLMWIVSGKTVNLFLLTNKTAFIHKVTHI